MIKLGYTLNDIPRLQEINDLSFTGPERATPRDFLNMLSISDVFLDRYPREIVGFAIVNPVPSPYLWHLAIHPCYQNCGRGTDLLKYIDAYYGTSGAKEIRLHVRPSNPAQKLYFDLGYRVCGMATDHYGLGYPALLMKKEL